MIYLDYSATTPVRDEVLDSFVKTTKEFIGNANSLHALGLESKKLMEAATSRLASMLAVEPEEVIFTSSASEANNMVLKGVTKQYENRGKHIITTKLEHSSILDTIPFLEKNGYEVDYAEVDEYGQVSIECLQKYIREDTILISIHQVNSEVGILQKVDEIATFLKENYPKIFFHVDGTQSVGKIPVSLKNIDLFTFSAHKFYGLKGIACLIKKRNVGMIPLIHGGKSQSSFRSGTPAVPLMVSLVKALRLELGDLDENYHYVLQLNHYLREELKKIDGVYINSPMETSIPHILNISIPTIKPEVMLHALEQEEIYLSTKTACSKDTGSSLPLLAMGKSKEITDHSLRISISHDTTKEELEIFIKKLKIKIQELNFKKEV